MGQRIGPNTEFGTFQEPFSDQERALQGLLQQANGQTVQQQQVNFSGPSIFEAIGAALQGPQARQNFTHQNEVNRRFAAEQNQINARRAESFRARLQETRDKLKVDLADIQGRRDAMLSGIRADKESALAKAKTQKERDAANRAHDLAMIDRRKRDKSKEPDSNERLDIIGGLSELRGGDLTEEQKLIQIESMQDIMLGWDPESRAFEVYSNRLKSFIDVEDKSADSVDSQVIEPSTISDEDIVKQGLDPDTASLFESLVGLDPSPFTNVFNVETSAGGEVTKNQIETAKAAGEITGDKARDLNQLVDVKDKVAAIKAKRGRMTQTEFNQIYELVTKLGEEEVRKHFDAGLVDSSIRLGKISSKLSKRNIGLLNAGPKL